MERKGKEGGRRKGRRRREYKREDGEGSGLQRNEERVGLQERRGQYARNEKGRRKGKEVKVEEKVNI